MVKKIDYEAFKNPGAERSVTVNNRKPDGRTKTGSKMDIVKVLNLRDCHGLSFADIGKMLGFSRQNVNHCYKQFVKLFPDYQQTELYKDNKVSYLTQAEFILLQDLLDEDKRTKASLNNTGYVWDKVFNNNRAEQGKAGAGGVTVNIDIAYQEAEARSKTLRLGHGSVEVSVNTEDID